MGVGERGEDVEGDRAELGPGQGRGQRVKGDAGGQLHDEVRRSCVRLALWEAPVVIDL